MSARIKVCGMRDERTIAAMKGLPIDVIGLIFAQSRRQVDPATAARLATAVRQLADGAEGAAPLVAGVFVNPEFEQLADIAARVPLDIVQLHGDETPALCALVRERLGRQVWKVFHVREGEREPNASSARAGAQRLADYRGVIDAALVDTAGGGTGRTFDWAALGPYREAAARLGVPLFAAGGLHAGNVGRLLAEHRPDGVDVSGGVETDGIKDIDKIREFVERVKQA
ncbi:phosphoribosylanthranilate isomerase [Paenibacillus sp. IB182496]|uniref:N-(5'-phosphoribosyl)anthranilate isomerase n=1 Tax=Paenibacillus sabuli TaxID=2772509 RepID=A0A927BTC5_9BACL|nr:phosphoribosylanthranilate isomerase [Paenibacillus sabuli]MBD2845154.1 phosphoribosylanthranilate isomerase [Paenibacillus sabuli]